MYKIRITNLISQDLIAIVQKQIFQSVIFSYELFLKVIKSKRNFIIHAINDDVIADCIIQYFSKYINMEYSA